MTISTRFANLSRACFAVLALAGALAISGCVHRIAIQQGNFLQATDTDRVAVGMTRVQVRALLGTPMVADPFQQSRWDYLYYFESSRLKEPARRHFIVFFDENDKVARTEQRGETPAADQTPELDEETKIKQAAELEDSQDEDE